MSNRIINPAQNEVSITLPQSWQEKPVRTVNKNGQTFPGPALLTGK